MRILLILAAWLLPAVLFAQPAPGPGPTPGGPVTVADCADVALGCTAATAWSGTGAAALTSLDKAIYAKANILALAAAANSGSTPTNGLQIGYNSGGTFVFVGTSNPLPINGLTSDTSTLSNNSNNLRVLGLNYAYNGTAWAYERMDSNSNLLVAPQATSSGGTGFLCDFEIKAAATACGSSAPHQPYLLYLNTDQNSAATYFQFYNATVSNTTVGTNVSWWVRVGPGGSVLMPVPVGVQFTTAMTVSCATAPTGNTNPSSNCSFSALGN